MGPIAELFLDAAEMIDGVQTCNHYACCMALGRLQYRPQFDQQRLSTQEFENATAGFAEVFKPRGLQLYWFGRTWPISGSKKHTRAAAARQEHRVMAMLFMHELAKDAGL